MKISYIYTKNKNKSFRILNFSPAQIIVGGFMLLILTGALLLYLPISASGERSTFINALFTATSAACVTGLVTYDTNTFWSPFGKFVIISLIQIGGLGIMSMSTIFSILLRRGIGVKERLVIQESINEFNLSGVVKTIKNIVIAVLLIETIGALILSTQLIPMYGVTHGILKSYFHSISALCNAGFDLFGQENAKFVSLVPLQNNPVIILTIAFLIIIGGIGFIVWKDIASFRKSRTLHFHSKVVLLFTLVLLLSGTFIFLILEGNNQYTLGNMNFFDKLINAFFASVTPRTAGFNSINIAQMHDSSNFLTVLLMFIGAAPGSTGGGIKVTTFFIIIFSVFSSIRGCNEINLLNRRISLSIVMKSVAIATLSMFVVLSTTMVLTINNEGTFLQCLYEATSAFATVGLSTGITPDLENISKILVVITMFLGRVGPLSAAIAFTLKQRSKSTLYKYPEGKITVG